MKKSFLIIAIVTVFANGWAQEEETPKWGIKFSGFVNMDYYFDSRQTVCAREGHFLLYPAPEKLDPNNEDINAKASFNMLAIRTRVRATLTGPDLLGAKSSAVIEGSFFGHSNMDLNEFRMRHAFLTLNWESTELLIGQYWHPMFRPACFPAVLSFNTGVPFAPFARNPQVRITHKIGMLSVSATALSHADFYTAAGIAGLRNSGMPELHAQAWYSNSSTDRNMGILLGGGLGFKRIVPMIETGLGYKTKEGFGSFAAEVWSKFTLPRFTVKLEGIYGQNNYDLIMLGSYAVTSVDPATGIMTYTPTGNLSVWTEVYTNHKTWQPGLFAGFTRNLGANQDVVPGSVQGIHGELDYVFRIAPRMIYNVGRLRFGLELEYTAAAFGTINQTAGVDNAKQVGNFRTLIGAFYFF